MSNFKFIKNLKRTYRPMPYNVEDLKNRFESMKLHEIADEYYYVDRMRNELLTNDVYNEEFVYKYIEPLDEAWDFLGQYLAKLYLVNFFGYNF